MQYSIAKVSIESAKAFPFVLPWEPLITILLSIAILGFTNLVESCS